MEIRVSSTSHCRARGGVSAPAPYAVSATVGGPVFSDQGCTSVVTALTIPANSTTATAFAKPGAVHVRHDDFLPAVLDTSTVASGSTGAPRDVGCACSSASAPVWGLLLLLLRHTQRRGRRIAQ